MTPEYKTPFVETPAAWSVAPPAANAVSVKNDWWVDFKSNDLNTLEAQAQAANTDVAASIARVQQARAGFKIANASLLPSVSANAGLSQGVNSGGDDNANWQGGLSVAYEADLFGANRANVQAAFANVQASEFDKQATSLVVTSEVARGYFTLLNLRARLKIADENIANAAEVLRIVKVRQSAGAVSPLEVAQQQSSLSAAQASRSTLIQQIAAAENALAVLLGKPPQSQTFPGNDLNAIAVPSISAGIPSELLQNRPDIRRAEAQLVAANANIGTARAAFYPSLSLSAGSTVAATLGNPAASALSLAAGLAAPIFQGGRLEGGVEQATARQQELIASYRGTVLTAFREVENALAALKATEAREGQLSVSAQAAQETYRLSRVRFDSGSIDFQTLLDAQRTLLSTQDNLASVRLERLSATIDLFKALGGGSS